MKRPNLYAEGMRILTEGIVMGEFKQMDVDRFDGYDGAPERGFTTDAGDRTRYALVTGARDAKQIEAYLPRNYRILIGVEEIPPVFRDPTKEPTWLISGEDDHGWTLDDYVIPRLASGLITAKEVWA